MNPQKPQDGEDRGRHENGKMKIQYGVDSAAKAKDRTASMNGIRSFCVPTEIVLEESVLVPAFDSFILYRTRERINLRIWMKTGEAMRITPWILAVGMKIFTIARHPNRV